MKRLAIAIEDDIDRALEAQAQREATSKAALIRRYLSESLRPLPPIAKDPLRQMIGVDDFDPEPINAVVYR